MTRITVYTKPACVQCNLTKARLDAAGIDYDVADLTAPEQADSLERFKAQGLLAAPVVVVQPASGAAPIAWSGFQPDAIDEVVKEIAP